MVAYATEIFRALFRITRTREVRGDVLTENIHSFMAGRILSIQERVVFGYVLVMSLLLFLDTGRQWLCLGPLGADMVEDLRAGFVHLRTLVLLLTENGEVQTQLLGPSRSTAPLSLARRTSIMSLNRI